MPHRILVTAGAAGIGKGNRRGVRCHPRAGFDLRGTVRVLSAH